MSGRGAQMQNGSWRATAVVGAAVVVMGVGVRPATAADTGDPDRVAVGVGYYDLLQGDEEAAEFLLEYRPGFKLWLYEPYISLKGFAGLAATTSGSFFAGLGPAIEITLGHRIVITGSFGPFAYVQGAADKDLGSPLVFRSQGEIAYQFDNKSRLGLAFSHYSNAGLGDENPGTETVSLYYAFPF